jgi:uncharacterized repeat protein (TIGR03803 family)
MSRIRSVLALCALGLCAGGAHAQTTTPAVSNLIAFSISTPTGNLALGSDGAIYGVSSAGTSVAGGLIYRAAIDGSSIRTVFQIDPAQGLQPLAGLTVGSDGLFYGTTRFGSVNETSTTGTVFRIAPSGTDFTVLHRFATATQTNADFNAINTDGAYPEAELTEGRLLGSEDSDGYLYGVTRAGGPNGTGAVFKVSRDGADFHVLHTFAADTDTTTSGLVKTVDGAAPQGKLVQDAERMLYGTTSLGGDNGRGVVFRLATDGSGFQVLHTFGATTNDTTTGQPENDDGAIPVAGLTDGGDGFFYGVTSVGGTEGLGVVFAISPDGGTFRVMHHFDGTTGARPAVELLLGTDGKLYGTTDAGGVTSSNAASTLGTIFSIERDGSGFLRLHSFDGSAGATPGSGLVQVGDADFVGTTTSSGRCGYGALYRYKGDGTVIDGDDRCGRRRNNSGGGHGGPALVLLLGSLAWWRRKVT